MIDLPFYDPLHWQNDARCYQLGIDPEKMQPERATRAEVAEAIAVCEGCPVIEACRTHADDQGLGVYGIHAGVWRGDEPVWMQDRVCEQCGEGFRAFEKRRQTKFCSRRCATAAVRARAKAAAVPA